MSRNTDINVNVNSGKSVSSITKIKQAFDELRVAKDKLGKGGKLKLEVDVKGIDVATLSAITKSVGKLGNSMQKLQANSKGFVDMGGVINATINQNIKNYTKAGNSVQNFGGKLKSTNKDILATSVAFGLLSASVMKYMKDYASLTASTFNVGIASQMNLTQIDQLNDSFLKLSTTVPSTAKEMSDAVDALIRTGRSFEESRKIIEQVAILSTASGDSLKDTSAVVTKVMVSLGISAERVEETLTTMHSTAIQTASDMGYLAEGFKNVAGTAAVLVKQSGLSGKALDDYKQKVLDVTMASIGSMANLGLSAS